MKLPLETIILTALLTLLIWLAFYPLEALKPDETVLVAGISLVIVLCGKWLMGREKEVGQDKAKDQGSEKKAAAGDGAQKQAMDDIGEHDDQGSKKVETPTHRDDGAANEPDDAKP